MESDSTPSTPNLNDYRDNSVDIADPPLEDGRPAARLTTMAINTAPTVSADDLARLTQLQLNEATITASASCSTLPGTSQQVSLTRQSSIHQYFTPLNLSPEPLTLFVDTPTAVNHSDLPRPTVANDGLPHTLSLSNDEDLPSPSTSHGLHFHLSELNETLDRLNIKNLRDLDELQISPEATPSDYDVTAHAHRPRPAVNQTRRLPLTTVNHTNDVTAKQNNEIMATDTREHNTDLPSDQSLFNPPETNHITAAVTDALCKPTSKNIPDKHCNPLPKPQRLIRTRRERMAQSSPPAPPNDSRPELYKLKESIDNIRLFEESLFCGTTRPH